MLLMQHRLEGDNWIMVFGSGTIYNRRRTFVGYDGRTKVSALLDAEDLHQDDLASFGLHFIIGAQASVPSSLKVAAHVTVRGTVRVTFHVIAHVTAHRRASCQIPGTYTHRGAPTT